MHKVKDVLEASTREPVRIDPLETVFSALKLMHDEDIGALLVDVEGFLVGIISERDYIRHKVLDHESAKNLKVSEIMTRDLITVETEDTVAHCIAVMDKHHVRHLPVVEAGKILGMVSLRDLFLDVVHDKYES